MEEKRFTLRMSAKLFDLVKQQADLHKRSTAKEIEFIIEEHLISEGLLSPHEERK